MFKKFALWLSRRKVMGSVVGFLLGNVSGLLPLRKVYETKLLLGFYHPVPSFDRHILVIPKQIVRTLFDVRDVECFKAVAEAALVIAKREGIAIENHLVRANGGRRQDVMQVHFHLFCPGIQEVARDDERCMLAVDDHVDVAYSVEEKAGMLFEIVLKKELSVSRERTEALLLGFMSALPIVDAKYGLKDRGYSLLMQVCAVGPNAALSRVYIEAG